MRGQIGQKKGNFFYNKECACVNDRAGTITAAVAVAAVRTAAAVTVGSVFFCTAAFLICILLLFLFHAASPTSISPGWGECSEHQKAEQ